MQASREKLEQTVQDLKDCLAKTERDRAQENLQVSMFFFFSYGLVFILLGHKAGEDGR